MRELPGDGRDPRFGRLHKGGPRVWGLGRVWELGFRVLGVGCGV